MQRRSDLVYNCFGINWILDASLIPKTILPKVKCVLPYNMCSYHKEGASLIQIFLDR